MIPVKRHQKMFAVLPTLLTLGNAACGFAAITFAAKVGPEPQVGNAALYISAFLIFLAMLFDMLDGSAARLTNQTSDFGAQLDSLCDAISFGIAPAFLMIQFTRHGYTLEEDLVASLAMDFQGRLLSRLLWIIGALYVVCALLRLARFNVETEEDDSHEHFSGLPSPAAAGAIASFPIAVDGFVENLSSPNAPERSQQIAEWLIPYMQIALPVVTFLVACLMVSRVQYPHFFNQLFRGQRGRKHLIQLVFTFAAIFVVHWMAVPLIFCFFAFASPIRAAFSEISRRRLYKTSQI